LIHAITPNFDDEHQFLQFISLVNKHPISHFIIRNKNLTFDELHQFRDLAIKHLPSKVKVIINPRKISRQPIPSNTLVHLNSRNLLNASDNKKWISASCHNEEEILVANKLSLEFVFLSPVLQTAKYPSYLGWENFATLAKESKHPVVALGGLTINCLEKALDYGANGIAGISMFSS
jgi:8-oxo-dGTP diphosphatase